MSPCKTPRVALLLFAFLPLSLAACGGGGDPTELTNQGYAALGSGDAEAAVDHFAQALTVLRPSDPGYERARMGEIEAKARVKPDAAAQSFLVYATDQPDQVDAGDYHKVGMLLADAEALTDAVVVLDAGIQRFPDDAKLREAMVKTSDAAEKSGDTGALDKIRGLGYAGGGER